MDELVIDDKKYISTKRASKMTGYAKDYVGQLCREGRVPARLVGRSWYVLESALQDHRFGERVEDAEAFTPQAPESVPGTWESPKYEPVPVHELPTVNRLAEAPSTPTEGQERIEEPLSGLQNAWREWFATQNSAPVHKKEETQEPEDDSSAELDTENDSEEPFELEEQPVPEEKEPIAVPIRAIYQELQVPAPKVAAPTAPYVPAEREEARKIAPAPRAHRTRVGSLAGRAVAVLSMLIMLAAIGAAVLSSGYMDSYAISNSTVGAVAGVALYKR